MRRATICLLVIIGLAMLTWPLLFALGQSPAREPWIVAEPVGAAELINVAPLHDADTPKGDLVVRGPRVGSQQVDLIFRRVPVRGRGYDAWEVDRTRDTEPFRSFTPRQWTDEISKGIKARDALQTLPKGKRWLVDLSPNDSVFSRKEGALFLSTGDGTAIDVAAWAKASGHDRSSK